MQVLGAFVLSIFVYYAVRLLSSFRKGMLEKGWKLVALGASILALAQVPYIFSSLFNILSLGRLSTVASLAGSLIRFAGVIVLILGFREQYQIWRVDKIKEGRSFNETSDGLIQR